MKKTGILILSLSLHAFISLPLWAQAPIVDDSDHYMLADELETAEEASGLAKSQLAQEQAPQEQDEETEELQPLAQDNSPDTTDTVPVSESSEALQLLQQEIQELRGQLEIQAHDLKLIQQQQLAFYKDLDSRLQATKGETNTSKTDQETRQPALEMSANKANERPNPANEQISYLAAYDLVKNKRYDDAILAMQNFIKQYPKGGYTANAHYWLGELYLLKNNQNMAIYEFETVLTRFPSSSKAAASELKKAYALADTGQREQAKLILQDIMKKYPDTNTAKLATVKLESLQNL
ncbi:MAG: tol-pal system protein YbgF [Legionellaceae bacterium]|nr:tol-pal system protein YbgF [Legionellaceae bacterium]